jgi:hypothetical protein
MQEAIFTLISCHRPELNVIFLDGIEDCAIARAKITYIDVYKGKGKATPV